MGATGERSLAPAAYRARCAPEVATLFGIVPRELAINAAKYGALSAQAGHRALIWTRRLLLVTRRADDHNGHIDHFGRQVMPDDPTWSVAEAKARFSEVLDQARAAPQTITRNGRRAAVVVSSAEWDRRNSRTGTLAEFFTRSPLRGSDIDLDRIKDRPRRVKL
jgi:prevent-host-death family protein